MKKRIAFVMIFALLATLLSASVGIVNASSTAPYVSIKADRDEVSPGDTVKVTVELKPISEVISGFTLAMDFDVNTFQAVAADVPDIANAMMADSRDQEAEEGHEFDRINGAGENSGSMKVSMMSTGKAKLTDGYKFTVTFKVKEGAAARKYDILFGESDIRNAKIESVKDKYFASDGSNPLKATITVVNKDATSSEQPGTPPTDKPSEQPGTTPTDKPSEQPGTTPTDKPSEQPGTTPTDKPSTQPSTQPSEQPNTPPSGTPGKQPGTQPSDTSGDKPAATTTSTSNEGAAAGTTGNSGETPNEAAKEGSGEAAAAVLPRIIKGENQKWIPQQDGDINIVSDAPYTEFIEVKVDDRVLDNSQRSVSEGSTVVTLKAAYLGTLSKGDHTVSIVSKGGTATTNLSVLSAFTPTGDTDNLMGWWQITLISLEGILVVVYKGLMKRRENEI